MVDQKPTPLLDMPSLVYERIILGMDTMEIFELSQCSKRARNYVKYSINRAKFTMDLEIEKYNTFFVDRQGSNTMQIQVQPNCHSTEALRRKFGNSEVQCDRDGDALWTFWRKNALVATGLILEELFDLFSLKHSRLCYLKVDKKYLKLFNWIRSLDWKFNEMGVMGGKVNMKTYSRILDQMDFTKTVEIGDMRASFKKENIQIPAESLRICKARWITLDNLFSLTNSKFFLFFGVSLTSEDINKFIKGLIEGKNPKLECLNFHFKEEGINREEVLKDIQWIQQDSDRIFRDPDFPNTWDPSKGFGPDGFRIEDKNGFQFQLNSEETATVFFKDPEEEEEENGGNFENVIIVVWRNKND